jgi:rubrerythrin
MNYEDILKEAEKKEIDARDYYRFLAERSINQYATETLRFLAAEEETHREYIREFLDALPEDRKRIPVRDTKDLDATVKKRTARLQEIRESIFPHTDEPTIVQKALDMEKNSFEMYRHAEEVADEENAKRLFAVLKRAEEKHIVLVGELLEKVIRLHEEFPETRPDL